MIKGPYVHIELTECKSFTHIYSFQYLAKNSIFVHTHFLINKLWNKINNLLKVTHVISCWLNSRSGFMILSPVLLLKYIKVGHAVKGLSEFRWREHCLLKIPFKNNNLIYLPEYISCKTRLTKSYWTVYWSCHIWSI